MNNKEQELFLKLCDFINPDEKVINELLPEFATPAVLGHLFFNRMQGVAYGVIEQTGALGKVNREFKNSLYAAYQQNIEKNNSFLLCLEMLAELLKPAKGKFAMLKGALLCDYYPKGYRTSNDVDLLVREKDVTVIGNILSEAGFAQGNVRNGEFKPATRREIAESKMLRGETVPYVIEVNLPYMRFLEVDINFSLDYKNSDGRLVDGMLSRAVAYNVGDAEIISLDKYDFFIHLCCHLYKEATTYPWVKMKRDMTLYKFTDIYMILKNFDDREISGVFQRAKELGLSEICACVVRWTVEIFVLDDLFLNECVNQNIAGSEELLNKVVLPAERKIAEYSEHDIKRRFFADDRSKLLEEIKQ
ncbi:MAG: hypothetical protein E7525_04485 [Ruminococcaceae bacterium]|nr:hypothetical protein [Oscillospiraceae bacterium]